MSDRVNRIRVVRVIGSLLLLLATVSAAPNSPERPIPSRIVYADDHSYPPHSALDSQGMPVGFNIELIKAIGKEIGIEIEVRLLPWEQVRSALEAGRGVDVSAMFYSEERKRSMEYAVPFATVAHEIYLRRGSAPVDSLDALKGKQVLVEVRSLASEFIKTNYPEIHLVTVDSELEAIRLLSTGTADAAIAPQTVGFYYIAQAGLKNVVSADLPILPTTYSFVTRNGRAELINELNRGMARIRRSGEYAELYSRWFGAHPPGLSTGVPWHQVTIGGIFVFFLTCGILVWTWSLRRQVAERTRRLQEELSERVRVERFLRESEAKLQAILDHSTTAIYLKDLKGRYLLANQALINLIGKPSAEIVGRTDWEIVLSEHAQQFVENDRQVLEAGVPMTFEESGEYQGAMWTFVSVKFPVRDPDGVIYALGGVSMDISDRKLIEREMRSAREAAERASRAKDHFLAILSHELRTPLTPVLVAVTEALSTDLPEELRPIFKMIQRNIELESRLIEDLLDLTRLVRGKLKLQFRTSDTHELIQQAAAICAPSLAEKQQEVRCEFNATRPYVSGDPARLQQVFWNLLQNAIKFSPKCSEIVFRSFDQDNGQLVIQCIDRGMGMERDVLDQIFRPFEQVESSISRHHGGLGLGLAISRMIIEAHHGSISAESAGLGEGAVFTITLPSVAAPAVEADRLLPEGVPERVERLRILLVEDSEDTRRVLSKLLRAKGHEVETAESVAAARQLWHQKTFDLLLSDIGLPDATGLELVEELRNEGPLRAIAFSGFGSEEDVRKSKDAGFAEHLVKPLDIAELKQALARVMTKSPVTKHGSPLTGPTSQA